MLRDDPHQSRLRMELSSAGPNLRLSAASINPTFSNPIVLIEPLRYRVLLGAFGILRRASFRERRWYADLLASLPPWRHLGVPWLGGCEFLNYWIAQSATEVIGVTGLYIPRLTPESTGWIGWTAVDENWRRRGVARALLGQVQSEALRLGMTALAVYTSAHHLEAISFYRSLGFEPSQGKRRALIFKKPIS